MIRFIVFRDEQIWVAQGLEVDICAQADSAEGAAELFGATVRCESKEMAAEGGSLSDIGKAPDAFFELWNAGDVTRDELQVA